MKKNIVLLLIDALRYDRIKHHGHRYNITPNLDKLCKQGYSVNNHFANGCPTELSFPSIFSSTYCLDHGGYNEGIKQRPETLAENLKKNNYQTFGITTAHPSSSHFGYDRGFDYYENLLDLYQWFRQNLKVRLRAHLDNYQQQKITKSQMLNIFSTEYKSVLVSTLNYIQEMKNYKVKQNKWDLVKLKKMVEEEIQIIDQSPEIILEKFLKYDYWYYLYLGKKKINKFKFLIHTFKEKLRSKINNIVNIFPRRRIYNAEQIFKRFFDILDLKKKKDNPFFFFLHIFDVHESKNFLVYFSFSFLHRLCKLLIARRFKFGGFIYDLSLMYVDTQLGLFIKKLEKNKMFENTILIVTSDHGQIAGHPKRIGFKRDDLSNFFYDEFIKVPLIFFPYNDKKKEDFYLSSHLDLAPTILDIAKLRESQEFYGLSILKNYDIAERANIIISESNGSGRCDLLNKPIFICVRSKKLKIIFRYEAKGSMKERDVFFIENDPDEMINLVDTFYLKKDRELFYKYASNRLGKILTY